VPPLHPRAMIMVPQLAKATFVALVLGGCSHHGTDGERVMADAEHSHHHVHAPDVSHGHTHDDFPTGAHTHDHAGH